MVKCPYCQNPRAKGDHYIIECKQCGITTSYPQTKGDLHRRQPIPFLNKLTAAILFKIYYFSVWFNRKMTRKVEKPRLGRP